MQAFNYVAATSITETVSLPAQNDEQTRALSGADLLVQLKENRRQASLVAVCEVEGPAGRGDIPAEAFCIGPSKSALQPGELLVMNIAVGR